MFSRELLRRSDCPSCQQFYRRATVNKERTKARSKGVPESQLPAKFSETQLGSNLDCSICVARLSQFRAYNRKKADKFK